MTDRSLALVKESLKNPNFVASLLRKGEPSDQLDGISFYALPSFYPNPYLRRTFSVQTVTGKCYLLKINEDGNSIRREESVCRWLRAHRNEYFYIPKMIAWDYGEQRASSGYAYWLLREWVSAFSVASSIRLSMEPPEKIIRGLVWLNKQAINNHVAQVLFRVHLPSEDQLLKVLTQRRNSHFEAVFDICSKEVRSFLEPLQKMMATFPFSKRLGLMHGDFHLDNILTAIRKDGTKYIWIDWEDATLDHPLNDIAHLLVFENFSPLSIKFLDLYLESYNRYSRKDSCLFGQEAWLLASVWLARTLRWRLRMQAGNESHAIEYQAIQSAQFILDQIKELNQWNRIPTA
jgi:hypothetical protein